jgi:hypothetical protein
VLHAGERNKIFGKIPVEQGLDMFPSLGGHQLAFKNFGARTTTQRDVKVMSSWMHGKEIPARSLIGKYKDAVLFSYV